MRAVVIGIILISLLFQVQAQEGYPDNGTRIDRTIFSTTVPPVMRMGRSYKVRIMVKNDSPEPRRIRIVLHCPGRYIHPDYDAEITTIGGRNTCLAEFKLTPIRPHIGDMNVTAYIIKGESPDFLPTGLELLDSVTVRVGRIDPMLSEGQRTTLLLATILLIAIFIFLIYRHIAVRNHSQTP